MVFAVPIADLLVLFLDHDFSKSNCEPQNISRENFFSADVPPRFLACDISRKVCVQTSVFMR